MWDFLIAGSDRTEPLAFPSWQKIALQPSLKRCLDGRISMQDIFETRQEQGAAHLWSRFFPGGLRLSESMAKLGAKEVWPAIETIMRPIAIYSGK